MNFTDNIEINCRYPLHFECFVCVYKKIMLKSISISWDYFNFWADSSISQLKKTYLVHCIYTDFGDLISEASLRANECQSSCWVEKYQRNIQVSSGRSVKKSLNGKVQTKLEHHPNTLALYFEFKETCCCVCQFNERV